MSPEGLYHERRALVPWSIPRHLELARWNLHVIPIATTIFFIKFLSDQEPLLIIDEQGREIRLPHLPIEMWWEILKKLNCGDFGLPAP